MSQPPKIQVDPLSRRPFVPLPSPFERYRLTLSDRSLDAPSITSVLSIPSIATNLSSVPEPYTLRDAEYWLSLPPQGNDEARYLRDDGVDWDNEDTVREQLKERIPFCVIRDSEDGKLVGSVSLRRNNWEWLNASKEANVERERLVKTNEALPPGDPESSNTNAVVQSIMFATTGTNCRRLGTDSVTVLLEDTQESLPSNWSSPYRLTRAACTSMDLKAFHSRS